jgi:hypothetical protein
MEILEYGEIAGASVVIKRLSVAIVTDSVVVGSGSPSLH